MFRILIIVAAYCLFTYNLLYSQVYYGTEANKIIQGAIKVYCPKERSFPSYALFNSTSQISAEQLLVKWKRTYQLEAVFLKEETDQLGIVHKTYQQTFNNLPVEFAIFRFHIKDGLVESYSGNIYKEIHIKDITNITFQAALEKAKSIHNAQKYAWEDDQQESILRSIFKKDTSFYPKEQKVIYKTEKGYEVAYKITLYSLLPLKNKTYYISTKDGSIIDVLENIHSTDVTGTAVTRYSGIQTITTDYYNNTYRLRESGRGNGIVTLNMQNTSNISSSVDFTDDDNYWNNVNPQQDEIATDAHWATEKYYDYLYNMFGRNSLDNNGYALYSYIHSDLVGLGYSGSNINAVWNGSFTLYGDGDTSLGISPLTTVDIIGHELTHGLTSFTAQLIYSGQSGMLSEAFSDIFGTVLEFYAKPNQANWLIGNEIGFVIRSLENPNQYGDPDTYQGQYWSSSNGALHQNSTVISHWFYLVAQGGTGINDLGNSYQVNGIGILDAAKIAYRTLAYYLPPNATFLDARIFSIISAIDLFGTCSPQVETVTNAMYAVGIGQAYLPEVIADFNYFIYPNCQNINNVKVKFYNNSLNGWQYYWDFGDSSYSNLVNPVHNYIDSGNFNVTLIVDGGNCGIDTITKNLHISTIPEDTCIVTMPYSGTTAPYISCNGILYDNGGRYFPYFDQSNSYITIKPHTGGNVILTFIYYNIEGINSYGDTIAFIEIFDGPNTSSPSLGKLYGTGSYSTFVSSGNSLTVWMYSQHNYYNFEGFEAQWTCVFSPPLANFSVTSIDDCKGLYAFYDQSLNYPTAWFWDFGDGQTSTLKNPIHEYQNNGTYSVKLIVSNSGGIDSVTYTDIITVQRIDLPQVVFVNDTVCTYQSATIIANTTDETFWYSSQNDSIPIFVGDTLITPPLFNQINTFWVQNVRGRYFVGDNRVSSNGSYVSFPYNTFLNFDCYTECKLVSVLVNSYQYYFNFQIMLTDSNFTTLSSKIFSVIPWGSSRINLNFDLPVANNLKLVAPINILLWANSSGASYPYTVDNVISIKSNNAIPNGYIYFYNWEIRLPEECSSTKVPVEVYTVNCTNLDNTEQHNINIYPVPANDKLNIDLPADFKLTSIKCFDLIGKTYDVTLILNDDNISIDTKQLPNGIYFLQLSNNYKSILTKIIVLH